MKAGRLSREGKALVRRIDEAAGIWRALALKIHAHPELGLEERQASAWLAAQLSAEGFDVRSGVGGLPTAFLARAGAAEARPRIAFLAEYDALPGLGHACSHNLICTAACLAATGLATVLPTDAAAISVIGCPAEESFGGKAQLLERGLFRDVDAALMAHGYFLTLGARPAIGRASLVFEFFGRAAHASTAPATGRNALDALLLTFSSVALLRQQVLPDARIHGIITHGGEAANIIPAYTRAEFYVRSPSTDYLRNLRRRVIACARGAAEATGTRLKLSAAGKEFLPIRPNDALAQAFEANVRLAGGTVDRPDTASGSGSTDFGNVSQALPALHGYFRIVGAPVPLHSERFAAACRTERALDGMVQAAKALALTGLDLARRPQLLAAARREWEDRSHG